VPDCATGVQLATVAQELQEEYWQLVVLDVVHEATFCHAPTVTVSVWQSTAVATV